MSAVRHFGYNAGMSNLRFYSPTQLNIGDMTALSENASAHAIRVMRLKAGDTLTLFCGDGFDYECALTHSEKKVSYAKVLSRTEVNNESPLTICLLQGISSGDRMDYTIQKAVELGVTEVFPLSTERSVTKLSGDRAEKRVEHWQGVAIAACDDGRFSQYRSDGWPRAFLAARIGPLGRRGVADVDARRVDRADRRGPGQPARRA